MKRVLPLVLVVSCVALSAAQTWPKATLNGSGDAVSSPIDLRDGLLMVGAAYKGDRNLIVSLDGPTTDIPINVIGEYKGVTLLPVKAGRYRFSVTASSQWVLMYEQPDPSSPTNALPMSHSAEGDSPLGPFAFKPGLLLLKTEHSGARNFVVSIYKSTGELVDIPVNKIGAYAGTVSSRIRSAGSYWLGIHADGPWSLSLSQD